MTSVSVTTKLKLQGGGLHIASVVLPTRKRRWQKAWRMMQAGSVHSIGVHIYSRLIGPDAYELAVRWSNGALQMPSGTGFCGRVYYDELSIEVPAGHVLDEPVRYGGFTPSAVRHTIASGGGHVFPPRAILERRFLVMPQKMADAEKDRLVDLCLKFRGVAFPYKHVSWGPAREQLPEIDRARYGAAYRSAAAQAAGQVATGAKGRIYGPSGPGTSWPLLDVTGAFGPFICDGDPQAGAPAGYEIDMAFGWPQVPEALELASIAHECSMARNCVAMFDMATGEPISVHDWPSNPEPQLMNKEPGKQSQLELTAFCVKAGPGYSDWAYRNFNVGTCAYRAALEGYRSDDTEHAVRAIDDGAQLAFHAGDMMAEDDLKMLFEHHRTLGWSDRLDAPVTGGSWLKSLTRTLSDLTMKPGKGNGRFLRSWGWMLTMGVFGGAGDSWLRKMLKSYTLASDRHGLVQREYHEPYIPHGWQGTQHFHDMIDKCAAIRAARLVNDKHLLDEILEKIAVWRDRILKDRTITPQGGTQKWLYLQRPDGTEVDPITLADTKDGPMKEHELAVIGLAALCEIELGDMVEAKAWLDAGLLIDTPHSNLANRLAWIRAKPGDLSQYASFAAAIEAMG